MDKRLNFIDSSIWNRYISLHDILDEKLPALVNSYHPKLESTKPKCLQTNVAKEFIEFNARLLRQSYLHAQLAHSSDISPFYFHSETEMAKKTDKILDKFVKNNYQLEWRLLLIDDYCDENLTGYTSRNDRDIFSKKVLLRIICNEIIESLEYKIKKKINASGIKREREFSSDGILLFEIGGEKNLDEASKNLQNDRKKNDIILLDFLLGHREDKSDEDGMSTREYINELLELIDKSDKDDPTTGYPTQASSGTAVVRKKIIKNKGPLNYFWFIPITSFTTALFDKLRESGLLHHSKHWHLARGADPVNTPELFKYSLLKFMELQIEEVDFDHEKLIHHLHNSMTFGTNPRDVRDWAKSYYQIFISRFGHFHLIKQDRQTSLFSGSMYDYMINNRTEALILYEKMRNFLFLLANGTYDDCGQLIKSHEELLKVISTWQQEEEHISSDESKEQLVSIKESFETIREYVFSLRR
ncbi:MAG: hypothetical protein K9H15_05025 [Bacteroidales bacterium]|nr:hypothetical protein [Bacteroidales bacterium]